MVASRELENVLDGILSKFNVIGFGSSFNVQILESLVKSGSQPGVISSNVDEAFSKILEKFEATPTAKFKIPGQATIDVPMTDSNHNSVTFETSVILDLNQQTMDALRQVASDPTLVQQYFSNDVNCEVKVEPKEKILTESEKTLLRLEN